MQHLYMHESLYVLKPDYAMLEEMNIYTFLQITYMFFYDNHIFMVTWPKVHIQDLYIATT